MFDDLGAVREAREVKGANYEAGRAEGRPVYRGPTAGKPATHPLLVHHPLYDLHPPPPATLRPPPLVVHPQKGGRREGIDDGG